MKKSDLRKLIRECISETLNEARLDQLFRAFVQKHVPSQHQDTFINLFYPFFNKSQENPSLQSQLIKKMIDAAIGKQLTPKDASELKDYGIDVSDKAVIATLARFHPFLVKFLQFVSQSS